MVCGSARQSFRQQVEYCYNAVTLQYHNHVSFPPPVEGAAARCPVDQAGFSDDNEAEDDSENVTLESALQERTASCCCWQAVTSPFPRSEIFFNPQKLADATISVEEDSLQTGNISLSLQMLAGKADKDGPFPPEGEQNAVVCCMVWLF